MKLMKPVIGPNMIDALCLNRRRWHRHAPENILTDKISLNTVDTKYFKVKEIEKMLFIITINSTFHLTLDKSPTYIYLHYLNENLDMFEFNKNT